MGWIITGFIIGCCLGSQKFRGWIKELFFMIINR